MNTRSIVCFIICGISCFIFLAGCSLSPLENTYPTPGQTMREGNLLKSSCPRITTEAPASDIAVVADGNNAFGWSLFNNLHTSNDNVFISPYSISLALAMAWVGAKGNTATEMAQALHFAYTDNRLLSTINTIDQKLATRGKGAAGNEGTGFTLQLADALWGEQTYTFLQSYLDPLAQYFGAGMRLCDFLKNAEQARVEINTWASDETHGKITNLIPPGALTPLTRLVITNTVYFDAAWADTFEANNTHKEIFFRLPSDSFQTWYMHQTNMFNYSENQSYQVLELPYDGGQVSMVFVLPKSTSSVQIPSYDDIKTLIAGFTLQRVFISLPKFKFTYGTTSVKDPLITLGMHLAFSSSADFSGIDGTHSLSISDVLHQAYVAVDEKGTTAAAATAVVICTAVAIAQPQPPVIPFNADHPFFFFIRDLPTGQILFIGYMATPTSAS
jgi:serpin B